MLTALTAELRKRDGVVLLGALGFENAYALAMRRNRAEGLGLRTLADLTRAAPRLTLGADLEFLTRLEWRSVQSRYGLRFARQTSYSPTFMYRAVADGSGTSHRFFVRRPHRRFDLVTLTDPRRALPGYDAVLLVAPGRATDHRLLAALRPLVGAFPVERMRQANLMVDRDTDKKTPAEAARWLDP